MPNFTNRFPEGNGSGYVNAGLPNITGTYGKNSGTDTGWQITTAQLTRSGALNYTSHASKIYLATANGSSDMVLNLTFDASKSNSIYGSSTTVQPATCKCYFCIKY